MDVVVLSRIQFAATAFFHFLFVPMTLGTSWLIAWWEVKFVGTNDETYRRMARFWGKLFLINFVLGVVTGITMEFQFGMNWSEYARTVGDIFGAPLAIEATAAFFLESTFIGLWAFGWKKLSKKAHAVAIVIVAFGASLSALWICLANGWMQKPVGAVMRNGRAEMIDFGALLGNSYGWLTFSHTLAAGFVCGGFFVMGVSAWHLLRKHETDFFRRSFRTAAVFALAASVLVAVLGDQQGVNVAKTQPAKLAAMESHWESTSGAPYTLLVWPDAKNERNVFAFLKIPKGLSLMSYHSGSAMVRGLKSFPPSDRPPVWPVFVSFRLMVGLGLLFILLAFLGWWKARKGRLEASPKFLRIVLWALPLPILAIQAGWIVTEMGRQPWIVYGLMRTSEGVSKAVSAGQVWFSLVGFIVVYGFLGAMDLLLLTKTAKKGPEEAVR